jgi:BlaI family transcriptional regulator, penicillinase repressor
MSPSIFHLVEQERMPRKKVSGPTDKELEILSILWSRGPSTVRDVNEFMNRQEPTGYTTSLKLMQLMYEKGLLTRDESSRTHVYSPASSQALTQQAVVSGLLNKVFAGSAAKLIMRALSITKVSPEELAEIKKLIAKRERENS